MNSLSWFLYLADTLHGLGVWLAIIMILLGIAMLVIMVGASCATDTMSREDEKPHWRNVKIIMVRLAFWFVVCGFVSVVIPSKNTMYAIAASQLGEKVATSEIGSDATKALHAWIKKQIEPATEAKK